MLKLLKATLLIIAFNVTQVYANPVVSADPASGVVALFNQETSNHIELLLENPTPSSTTSLSVAQFFSHEQIDNLYRQRDFEPIWIDGWQLKPGAQILLEYLRNAGAHGLCSNDFLLPKIEGLFGIYSDFARHSLPLAPDNRAVLELFLSQAFLSYATEMVEGQVDPALAHVDWRARRRKADLIKLLEYAINNHRMSKVLEALTPPHEEYRQLMMSLSRYQEISARGGWPKIPMGPLLEPGERDERILQLRNLLIKTGDLEKGADATTLYDPATAEAMRLFQSRHGLVEDGVVGPKTLKALNVPVEDRIRQIELNLERWRWMPKSFGKRHIRVNVAGFTLDVIENGESVMQMPVIVGTRYRKTPVFSASMTYLEFAPFWTVPSTILREDKLPKIKRDPAYLEEKHFRIISRQVKDEEIDPQGIDWSTVEAQNFPGLLRMDPGPWNPLGSVKFIFPNRFNVYLHDTNQTYLFNKNIRSFSSGCIRVKRPRDLAAYLLESEIGEEKLLELFEANVTEKVPIKSLPVHIQYWTAWVNQDGLVNFRPDVYWRDIDLDVALTEPAYRVMDQLKVSVGTRLASR